MNKDLRQLELLPTSIEVKIVTNDYNKDELLRIVENYSLSPTQSNSVGTAFRNLGELELAETYFLLSIELEPKYDEPYAHLISLYALQNRFDLCESIFQLGNKNATKKTYIMYHDGRVSFLKGNYKGSLMAGRCILIDEKWNDENAILLVINSLMMLIRNNESENVQMDFIEAELAWKKGLTLFPASEDLHKFSKIFSDK